jgi:hypothetical protein
LNRFHLFHQYGHSNLSLLQQTEIRDALDLEM